MDVSTPQCGGHYGCQYASVRWSLWMSVRLSAVVIMMSVRFSAVVIMDVNTPQCGGHYGCQYASVRWS